MTRFDCVSSAKTVSSKKRSHLGIHQWIKTTFNPSVTLWLKEHLELLSHNNLSPLRRHDPLRCPGDGWQLKESVFEDEKSSIKILVLTWQCQVMDSSHAGVDVGIFKCSGEFSHWVSTWGLSSHPPSSIVWQPSWPSQNIICGIICLCAAC